MSDIKLVQHILVRSLCRSRKKGVNERVIAELSEENFTASDYREAFRRIKTYYIKSGRIMDWKEVVADSTIDEETRKNLRAKEVRRMGMLSKDPSLKLPETYSQYKTFITTLLTNTKLVGLIDLSNMLGNKLSPSMPRDRIDLVYKNVVNRVDTLHNISFTPGRVCKLNNNNIRSILTDFKDKVRGNFFLPTGFTAFDSVNLGIPRDSFWLMAGKSGTGKSTLAIQVGLNMRKMGARVCFIPMEMSKGQILFKMASNLRKQDMSEMIMTLRNSDPEILHKFLLSVEKSLLPIMSEDSDTGGCFDLYEPEPEHTLVDVLSSIKHHKYDIIFVDYISLLSPIDPDNAAESLNRAGAYAKVFAKNNDTAICLLAQLDEDKNRVRYSRALSEHASNAWFWQETKEEIRETGMVTIIQKKARTQSDISFKLACDLKTSSFSDWDGEVVQMVDSMAPQFDSVELKGRSNVTRFRGRTSKFDDGLPGDDDV
jgi:KaiC/GvpD/RAD55 family RecA-like ATPase